MQLLWCEQKKTDINTRPMQLLLSNMFFADHGNYCCTSPEHILALTYDRITDYS